MDKDKMIAFVELMVNTIQSDYTSTQDAREAMVNLLEEADRLYMDLKGERIVERGQRTVLEVLTGSRQLKIK